MSGMSLRRRFGLALTGVALSAYLLRPQIADALLIRGDERLYRGDPTDALRYYRRALWIDATDGAAVDRFLFVATQLHDAASEREGVALAGRYLRLRKDADVQFDRAMANRALGRLGRALADFAAVGRASRDARAYAFAGYAADALGERARAIAMWRAALSLDSGLPAARDALRRAGVQP
jgi:hypothetical protein